MNNGKTQTGVSRRRQANRLQTCITVKCPQLLALARVNTKHFTFDGKSNTETDDKGTVTKTACDGLVCGSL